MRHTSFLSEHSCEYLIVDKVLEQLEIEFTNVIPLFYWSSREGGNMAKDSLRGCQFKLLAVYPRRPKVSFTGDNEIVVNFNELLFERAQMLLSHGIQSFAAVPLISNLKDYNRKALCQFWRLGLDGMQVQLTVSLDGKCNITKGLTVISPFEISKLVKNDCSYLDGEQVLEIMRDVRRGFGNIWGMMNDEYKPIYFLVSNV